jgi:hypothetical protein
VGENNDGDRSMHTRAALLVLVLVGIAVANAVWIHHNADYIQDEVSVHLDGAADFRNRVWGVFAGTSNPFHAVGDLLDLMNSRCGGSLAWPRATYAVSALISALPGAEERWPFFSNFAFYLLSLVGTFGVMRQLYPREGRRAVEAGLIAAAVWSLFPGTYGPLRLYGLDFPLACCLMPGLALLMASRGFADRKMTVALGAFTGFALLVKGQFLLYLAPALLIVGVRAVVDIRRNGSAGLVPRLLNLSLAVIPPLLAVLLWLYGSLGEVARLYYIMVFPDAVDPAVDSIRAPPKPFEWFSLQWFTYWGRASVANLGVIGTVALALSPVLLGSRRGRASLGSAGWLVLGTAIGMFVLWTAIPARDMRFVFPFLPVYAAVVAMALMVLRPRLRGPVVMILLAAGIGFAARMSLDEEHNRVAAERIHRVLGWDAGHIMVRPPSPPPFPGLADVLDEKLDAIGRPARMAFAAVPYADGRSLFDHYNDQARMELFRLKCLQRSVTWRDNPFVHPRAVVELGSAELLDPRYLPEDYLQHAGQQLDLLVVFHFYTEYELVEPRYPSWVHSGSMPALFSARTPEDIAARAPEGLAPTGYLEYEGTQLPPARVYLFEKD